MTKVCRKPLLFLITWTTCTVLQLCGLASSKIIQPGPWLPDLLEFENGTTVTNANEWTARRLEVLKLAETTFLGTIPSQIPPILSHKIINTTSAGDGVECVFIECVFDTSAGPGNIDFITVPIEIIQSTAKGTHKPVFMTQWNHREWAVSGVARGYIGVVYPASDARDVAPLFQKAYSHSSFALIAARAWVGARCLDFVLAHWKGVIPSQIALSGHSRNGKQSLVFAAIDERIGAVVGSSPGAPIAAPYRFTSSNYYGEGPRTGGVTCSGNKWWLCSSLKYDGHPETMAMDGHGVLAAIAPRAAAIATGHQDEASDMTFAGEMNIRAASAVFSLLNASQNVRNIYRYGRHHGFDDISTYFDWFDRSFNRTTPYAQALLMDPQHGRTADSLLTFYQTYLTPAGFDWQLWNSTSDFARTPPPSTAPLSQRVGWLLSLGPQYGGELGVFSMGATYGEESEGDMYIPGMMGHVASSHTTNQPFSFGDYLSGQAYWPTSMPVDADKPQPVVLWLHPYSYNTGYTPTYEGAHAWSDMAAAGYIVMAYDQVGFGIRNTQGGNRFYARHGGNASLFGHMVKDAKAAIDFLVCRSTQRTNAPMCSQHGYATSNAGIDRIPYIDLTRIYVMGYSMGGMVALHTAALDDRVAAAASFAAFTPFRTDTRDKPTGGLARLSSLHALIPKLGLYVDTPESVPYDWDEIITAIAPRPLMLYTPQSDRDATFDDVDACIKTSASAWPNSTRLTHLTPNSVTKMEAEEVEAAITWLKSLP
eukprot:m.159300 g.159300  ORF g.159300 m.159300 type:complete len:763 (+) comp31130_c0_seq2:1-2289(+)